MTKKLFALGAAMVGLAAAGAQASGINPGTVSPYVLADADYTQDFDSLTPFGSNLTALPEGWQFYEGGDFGDGFYVGGVSNTSGGIHAYGSGTERALGGIPGSTITPLHFGVIFENGLGAAINALDISYTGEQWYNTAVAGKLTFEYSLDAPSINDGTWTAFSALDFVGPATGANAVDGNAAANRSQVSALIDGLSIGVGDTFALRWTIADSNPALTEDGLAVDDLTITASTAIAAVPEPATWAMMIGGFGLAGAALRRRATRIAFA